MRREHLTIMDELSSSPQKEGSRPQAQLIKRGFGSHVGQIADAFAQLEVLQVSDLDTQVWLSCLDTCHAS